MKTLAAAAIAMVLASSAAVAGDMGGRSHPHRLFPSELDTYRSRTVELHLIPGTYRLAANTDQDGLGMSGAGLGSGPDGFGNSSSAVTKTKAEMRRETNDYLAQGLQALRDAIAQGWRSVGGGNGDVDTSRTNGDDGLSGGACCSSDDLGQP